MLTRCARESGAFLEFDWRPTGRVKIAFDHGGSASGYVTLDIGPTTVGSPGSFLAAAVDPKHARLVVGVLILLIAMVSSVIEARACEHSSFRGAFACLLFLRLAAIIAAGVMASSMLQIVLVLAIVLPWLAILRARQLRGSRPLGRRRPVERNPCGRRTGSDGRPWPAALVRRLALPQWALSGVQDGLAAAVDLDAGARRADAGKASRRCAGQSALQDPEIRRGLEQDSGAWQASFALEGLFDQSFMDRPDLTPRRWPLDFTAALQTGLLPQQATMQWLGSRFGP
jgi:hypothetical protein